MSERDEIIYESYLAGHMALQQGELEYELYGPSIIYNLMLHDLNGMQGRPVELATEQLLDYYEFAVRVHELVAEFLGFAVPNSYDAVDAGILTRDQADEQVKEMLDDLLSGDFVERVMDVAHKFIEELEEYSDEEIAAAILFGCHPQVLRDGDVKFIVDDAGDFSQES